MATELKIEKGIPVPRARTDVKEALYKMVVGDSVLFPPSFDRQSAANILGKGNYATRKMDGGLRVWRIK